MPRSSLLLRAAFTAALIVSTFPLFAAQPYHLELEAAPAAVFPYLGKFGTVELRKLRHLSRSKKLRPFLDATF